MHKRKSTQEINKYFIDLKNELNMAETFSEYFLIIGVDPKICFQNYIFQIPKTELEKFCEKEIKPEILTKYPPMNKTYVNIDDSLVKLCFPEGFHLEENDNLPKPEILNFLLDNNFYSIDYPQKYVTCLKIYENLDNYFELRNCVHKIIKNDNDKKLQIFDSRGAIHENHLININPDLTKSLEALDSLSGKDNKDNKEKEKYKLINLKKYYLPKVLCLISVRPFLNEYELILKKIYKY